MNQQKLIKGLSDHEKMEILKEGLKSEKVYYNGKCFDAQGVKSLSAKSIKILEKGLGISMLGVESHNGNMRVIFSNNGSD